MILFPAMLVGGHLLVAVVDRVPDLNFEPICREGAAEFKGAKDDSAVCMASGFAGFQAARTAQMVTQYRWINQPDGWLRWRRKAL